MRKRETMNYLEKQNRFTHEVCKEFGREIGHVLHTLVSLANEGKIQRLQSGVWALSNDERQRRRRARKKKYDEQRNSPGSTPNATVDPSPFPRPWWDTPNVGLWG